jgi:4-amino-4-deoxy-L-arabinose transferase-like glycosyltransferase
MRLLLLALCLLAVGLRAIAVVQYEEAHPLAAHLVIDERSYDEWGARIAQGDWLGEEVFFQEPLYPYFLGVVYALLGHDLHALRLVQCLLGGITTWLLWCLGRRVCGPSAGWIAALGFCLYPAALLLPCLVLKPNLFLPLFAGFVLLVLRRGTRPWTWLAAGALGALGALLRGNLLILLPVFALWPLLRGERPAAALRAGALFCAGALVVLLPVLGRNWHVGGVLALTTSGAGTNVFGGNNADNPYGIATEFDWVRGIPRYEADDWRREAARRLGRELDAAESSSYWLAEVWRSLRRDPALHLSIFWNKLRLALGDYEVPDNHHLEWDRRYVPLLRLGLPGFAFWGGLALAGLLLCALRRELRRERLELAVLFVLYLGTIVLTVMSMRARLPLLVLLLPFAGSWVVEARRSLSGHGWRAAPARALTTVALTLGCLVGVSLPIFDERAREHDLADRDYNLVVSWLEREVELDAAARSAQELALRYPNSSRLQTLLADTEWRRGSAAVEAGERAAGEELLDRALARLRAVSEAPGVNPRERSRALRLAGYIQADLRNWPAAERFFGRAREFAAEDLELRVSHGQALLLSARELAAGDESSARVLRGRALLEGVIEEAPRSPAASGARRLLEELP